MAAPLAPPRIVIASNNEEGKSVFSRDTEAPLFGPFGPTGSQFATLFHTDAVPASNTAPLTSLVTTSIPRSGPKGTFFGTSDMAPNGVTPFHRTTTLDYMVVLKGEIVARLDDGVEKTIREGEMMVQMGSIHAWVNKTDQWCRMLFVMMAAEQVVLKDGTVLEDAFFPVQ
jgi:quercetin dioxygenase-like cupin family protein